MIQRVSSEKHSNIICGLLGSRYGSTHNLSFFFSLSLTLYSLLSLPLLPVLLSDPPPISCFLDTTFSFLLLLATALSLQSPVISNNKHCGIALLIAKATEIEQWHDTH